MQRNARRRSLLAAVLVMISGAPSLAQGVPVAVSVAGKPSAMAFGVQGVANGIPVSSSDANNAPFVDWIALTPGTAYGQAQLAGVRSIEMNLTAAGTVILTSAAGNVMAMPYPVTGLYQLPFVPARIDLADGAGATFWMLR